MMISSEPLTCDRYPSPAVATGLEVTACQKGNSNNKPYILDSDALDSYYALLGVTEISSLSAENGMQRCLDERSIKNHIPEKLLQDIRQKTEHLPDREKYVHIELGAGNTRSFQGEQSPKTSQLQYHHIECPCRGCDTFKANSSPDERFSLLGKTIDDLADKADKSSVQCVLFFINDLYLHSVFHALDYAIRHYREKHSESNVRFEFYPLYGDLFSLPINTLKPDFVHLKNPDPCMEDLFFPTVKDQPHHTTTIPNQSQAVPDEIYALDQRIIELLQRCTSCKPPGLVITTYIDKEKKREAVKRLNQYEAGRFKELTDQQWVVAVRPTALNYECLYKSYTGLSVIEDCRRKKGHAFDTEQALVEFIKSNQAAWIFSIHKVPQKKPVN